MFKELQTPTLSSGFNSSLMIRIEKEARKRAQATNILSMGVTCLVALLLIAGGIYCISLYSDFNIGVSLASYFTKPEGSQHIDNSLFPFYSLIGVCALLLLGADYKMRKIYQSRHK